VSHLCIIIVDDIYKNLVDSLSAPKATKADSPLGASMRPTPTARSYGRNLKQSTNKCNQQKLRLSMINIISITEIDGKFDRINFGSIDIPT
jgi:hypothetical protein